MTQKFVTATDGAMQSHCFATAGRAQSPIMMEYTKYETRRGHSRNERKNPTFWVGITLSNPGLDRTLMCSQRTSYKSQRIYD